MTKMTSHDTAMIFIKALIAERDEARRWSSAWKEVAKRNRHIKRQEAAIADQYRNQYIDASDKLIAEYDKRLTGGETDDVA